MRRFERRDLARINSWLMARGEKPLLIENLPEVGAISDHAAAFLLQTDSDQIALIDLLVTNPASAPRAAYRDATDIVESLLRIAGELGFTHVSGFTRKRSVARLMQKIGFQKDQAYFHVWRST